MSVPRPLASDVKEPFLIDTGLLDQYKRAREEWEGGGEEGECESLKGGSDKIKT